MIGYVDDVQWVGSNSGNSRDSAISDAVSAAFGSGQLGALYVIQPDYQGSAILWQDAAGTIPAVADGDPVGRIDDLSGGGNHATTPVPGTLRGSAGNWRLEFDGVDDYYDLPLSLAQNSPSLYLAFAGAYRELAGADKSMIWFSTGTSSTGTRARLNTRATTYLQAAGRRLDEGPFDTGVQAEVIAADEPFTASALLDYANASAWLRKNGVEQASGSFSTAGASSDTPSLEAYLGWQAGEYTTMDARAFAIVTGGTDGIAEIEALLSSRI
ncbi:hypothetical protein [uncultured Halomonas sp.]|uniref:hypothetical protein n=1 Tax=uncultured Halomonas sp. TaxID=173971 RepID=UPI00259A4640|nr:hypothetical protein [uncultured Halomonas sp.]